MVINKMHKMRHTHTEKPWLVRLLAHKFLIFRELDHMSQTKLSTSKCCYSAT